MVCHETYKDEDENWLSPNEVETKDGKRYFIKNQPSKKVKVGPAKVDVKIKKEYY